VFLFRIAGLLCSLLVCLPAPNSAFAEERPNTLHLIHRVFIEPVSDLEKVRTIEKCLEEELEKRGFQVVDDKSAAQGILSGILEAEITLDGDENDTEKAIYLFELKGMGGGSVWKARVKFTSKGSFAENNEYAARKLAEKLSNDSRKSAKRAQAR